MAVFFQDSSVAWSRSNGTILWHSFAKTPSVPVEVSSLDILDAWDTLLFDTTTMLHNNSTNLPLFSGSSFPTYTWLAEPEFSGESAINPAFSNGIYSCLQAFLAAPMYYCQSGAAARVLPAILTAKIMSDPALTFLYGMLSPAPNRTSPASFAHHRYDLTVSFSTIIAYVILSGATLFACAAAQIFIKFSDHVGCGSGRPHLSQFPTLDLFAHCTIEDENRHVMYQGRSGFFPADTSQRSLRKWLSTISIKWSKPHNLEDELHLFGKDFAIEDVDRSAVSMESLSPYPSRSKTGLSRSRDDYGGS